MQIFEVFQEGALKGVKSVPAAKKRTAAPATTPVSIGGQSIPPTDPLYQKIMAAPGSQPAPKTKKPVAKTIAPAQPRARDAQGRYISKGGQAFGQMAQQLGAKTPEPSPGSQAFGQMAQQLSGPTDAATTAPTSPKDWVGQDTDVPAYLRKQKAQQGTTPQQPQQDQQPQAPAKPESTWQWLKREAGNIPKDVYTGGTAKGEWNAWNDARKNGTLSKALVGHAAAGLGNAIRRNAPYGHYDTEDYGSRIKSSKVGAKDVGLRDDQIALVKPTGDPRVDQYLQRLGFFQQQQPQQGTTK